MKLSCFFIFRSGVVFCDCFTFSVGTSGSRQQLFKTPDSCLQTMCRLASQQRSELRHKQSRSPARRSFVFSFFHHGPCFRVPVPPANLCTLSSLSVSARSLQWPALCEVMSCYSSVESGGRAQAERGYTHRGRADALLPG